MIVNLFAYAFRKMAVYILGASGDIVIEKGGHLNMGVPGIMFFGALGGVLGELAYVSSLSSVEQLNGFMIVFAPLLMSILFGGIGGLLYCFLTVTLKCNQNVVGLALTTFGVGISRFAVASLPSLSSNQLYNEAAKSLHNLFPNYASAGAFGEIFLSGSFFTYFAIILAIAISIFIAKSKIGLNLRAVGENPASADAAGINVTKYRYLSTIIGAMIVGIAGATLILDTQTGVFEPGDPVDSFGWLALSIVILCAWRSWITIPVSFCISLLYMLPKTLSFDPATASIFEALPYVAAIIVLIISSAIGSKKMQPPAGLGKTYFREDR